MAGGSFTLGPKTRAMVTVVLSWVRMKPNKYFMSGPALGSSNKLSGKWKASKGAVEQKHQS